MFYRFESFKQKRILLIIEQKNYMIDKLVSN